jgi:hypothetical protein
MQVVLTTDTLNLLVLCFEKSIKTEPRHCVDIQEISSSDIEIISYLCAFQNTNSKIAIQVTEASLLILSLFA